VNQLEPLDRIHLETARGWIELGNWREANEELDRVTPQLRADPDVLSVRRIVCLKAGNMELAAEIERALGAANMKL
jgi:hypothetical protein